ncbi:TonB family protein [Aromatoleum toluvorans]|uniref:Protein TonB n=2 Tax=Aromatoleum toluvorans TaxID=92002 RepID=A0ABX1PYM7_9RHOO|nr:energy transducer TonB [Aromatoleum toluvorans]NMG44549.1 TonB family protein [Aromatoleum toluvorans]
MPGNGARNRASEPQSSAVAPPAVAAPDAAPQSPQVREREAPPQGHSTAPAAPEAAAPAPAAAGESISARLPSGGTGAPSQPARYDAAYLENPSPQYPKLSRRRGEEGKVTLRVRVRADGRAENVEIAQTSGHPRLDAAARETVLSWRFVPARQGGTPIDSSLLVPVVFRLDD